MSVPRDAGSDRRAAFFGGGRSWRSWELLPSLPGALTGELREGHAPQDQIVRTSGVQQACNPKLQDL